MPRTEVQERNLRIDAQIQGLSRSGERESVAAAMKVRTNDDL